MSFSTIEWVAPPTENSLTRMDDGSFWIDTCWNDTTTTPERLDQFLTRWPPSRTPASYASWISVDRGSCPTKGSKALKPKDIQGLERAFAALVEAGEANTASVDAIAAQYGVTVGKWLVFANSQTVDAVWASVVNLVCKERGWGTAKVSPRKNMVVPGSREDGHVICVYVDDYTDAEEVMALREGLRNIGILSKISFKPDAYTYLGIYSKNKWNIKPSRYYA